MIAPVTHSGDSVLMPIKGKLLYRDFLFSMEKSKPPGEVKE